ncbi:MAG: anaerobic magnesium-protoporphyrin IX monomethyl ester cyclase, partial [Candidatus Omnitrophota bacterium]
MSQKLDILFIHPSASKKIYQDLSKSFSSIEPPIWAGMLASHCLHHKFSAEILDTEALQLDSIATAQAAKKADPRVVCFVVYGQQPSASSQNMTGAVLMAEAVRNEMPHSKILFVGGHVSALSKDVLMRHDFIDLVCQNEGVYTISNLLRTNLEDNLETVKGLGWRRDGEIVLNEPSPIVAKADLPVELPGVPWDKLPMEKYRTSLWHAYSNNSEQQPFASIYTSLGCPMRCSFCMINIINRQENEYSDG